MTIGQFAAIALAGSLIVSAAEPARAEDPPTIEVTIKDHRFSPAEIHIPSGKPVILHITNADDTVEEFDFDRATSGKGDCRRSLCDRAAASARPRTISVYGRVSCGDGAGGGGVRPVMPTDDPL